MSIYSFFSSKGGQCTSTTAAAFAILLSENVDNKVLLIDLSESQDMDGVLAVVRRHNVTIEVRPTLDLIMKPRWTDDQIWALLAEGFGYTHWVIDWGTRKPALHEKAHLTQIGRRFFVTKACYLSLRRYISEQYEADALILIHEANRALRRQDIEAATARPIITEVSFDGLVSRSVDAGLVTSRLPRSLRTLEEIISAQSTVPDTE